MAGVRKHALSLRERRTYDDATMLAKIEARYECEPNSGCWLWSGNINGDGYGIAYCGGRSQMVASRLMYELTHQIDLPANLYVCHRCDTPACVNPAHLFLGTARDNALDAASKNRLNRWDGRRAGERNHAAKLTKAQVEEIRRIGYTQSAQSLAKRFGVSKTAITSIRSGRAWFEDWQRRRYTKEAA